MEIVFRALMFILGACFGSFLCCQARRLHLKSTPGKHSKSLGRRSVCLHCHQQLKWHDNIPLISWLFLLGKCRHCHREIGILEPLSELSTAFALLLLTYTISLSSATPLDWIIFIATTLFTLVLVFLAIYDGAYGELPTLGLILAIVCAIIILAIKTWATLSAHPFTSNLITDPLLAICILGGLYLALYLVSKGKWVGDGDWLLATAISLVLGQPWLALITLFLANFLACLVSYPILKFKNRHQIHLGPFLVIAFVIACSFSSFFLGLMV